MSKLLMTPPPAGPKERLEEAAQRLDRVAESLRQTAEILRRKAGVPPVRGDWVRREADRVDYNVW